MKHLFRTVSFLLTVFLMISSMSTMIYAASETVTSDDYVSMKVDALRKAGVIIGDVPSSHGNNQSRIVKVSSGTYLGVLIGDIYQPISADVQYEMALIRVNEDGTSEKLFSTMIVGTSTCATIMADNDENIWLYSGWSSTFFVFNLYKYDTKTGMISDETEQFYLKKGNGFGYSTAHYEQDTNRIVSFTPGGDKPGWALWSIYDLSTGNWSEPVITKVEYRYCYNYGFSDLQGGFFVVTERDVTNYHIDSDIELNVRDAMTAYRSRKMDADYMWDELHILHIPDPADAKSLTDTMIESADYDVQNGLYPDIECGSGDVFMDTEGYLHVMYSSVDDGVAGEFNYQVIYDVRDSFREVSRSKMTFLKGDIGYMKRYYRDTHGNFYVVATNDGKEIEIWYAVDALGTEYRLADLFTYSCDAATGNFKASSLAVANDRAGSVDSDVGVFMLAIDKSWYTLAIDFSKLNVLIQNRYGD